MATTPAWLEQGLQETTLAAGGSIMPVAAGDDLDAARPSGVTVVYWMFEAIGAAFSRAAFSRPRAHFGASS